MALNEFRSICLPYVLKKMEDGSYVTLNREYSPLGFHTEAENYGDYPIAVHYSGLTSKIAAKVSWNGSSDTDNIFLYNDGCIPTDGKKHMDAYLNRLAILAKLQKKRK